MVEKSFFGFEYKTNNPQEQRASKTLEYNTPIDFFGLKLSLTQDHPSLRDPTNPGPYLVIERPGIDGRGIVITRRFNPSTGQPDSTHIVGRGGYLNQPESVFPYSELHDLTSVTIENNGKTLTLTPISPHKIESIGLNPGRLH